MEEKKEPNLAKSTIRAFKLFFPVLLFIFAVLQASWCFKVVNYGRGCPYFEASYYLPFVGMFLGIPIGIVLTIVFSFISAEEALAKYWAFYCALWPTAILLMVLHPYFDKLAINTLVQRLSPVVEQVGKNEKATFDAKSMESVLQQVSQDSSLHKSVLSHLLPKMRVITISVDKELRCSLKLPLKMWTTDGEINDLIFKVAKGHKGFDPSFQHSIDREQSVRPVGKWLRNRIVYRDTGFVK